MKVLNIGLIGCGTIAPVHMDAIKKSPYGKLVAVCDIDLEKQKYFTEYQFTTHYHDLINNPKIDVIHVLTPHDTHYEIAKNVLEKKHCLLEKPMTIKSADAKKLVEIAKNTPNLLGIAFQNRFNQTSLKIKQLIDNKTYGALKSMKATVTWNRDKTYYQQSSWRGTWDKEGGGVLINQAIHTLDLLQWFGGPIQDVSGYYQNYSLDDIIEVEDTAVMFLKFKNQVQGLLFATNANPVNSPIDMEIVFENATIYLVQDTLYVNDIKQKGFICQNETKTGEKAYWGLSHEYLIDAFYRSILFHENQYIHAKDGAQTIEILNKFYQNALKEKHILIENTKEW